eukprot:SAG11_NODE_10170_length_850_cov_0.950732_1_plen_80_part_10
MRQPGPVGQEQNHSTHFTPFVPYLSAQELQICDDKNRELRQQAQQLREETEQRQLQEAVDFLKETGSYSQEAKEYKTIEH